MVRGLLEYESLAAEGGGGGLMRFQAASVVAEGGGGGLMKFHRATTGLGVFDGEDPLNSTLAFLLLEVSFVILTTRLLRFLLKPLKQPKIVSQVIGGIIVGPSVLGWSRKSRVVAIPDQANYLVRNVGLMGFMYFLFVSGVKMDMTLVKKSGKKQLCIAFIGVFVPTVVVIIVALLLRNSMDDELRKFSSIGAVATSLAITAFPVLYPVLQELNLLSSEVGRMALSTSIISDVIGINAVVAFEAAKQGEAETKNALCYLISLVIIAAFFVLCVGRLMNWIIATTPEGRPVDQSYVIAILLGVLVMGFLTDMFGLAIANGPLWLGLVIPDGPPLGATLVERSETIIMEVLMPFAFTLVGLFTDVFAMLKVDWSSLKPLFTMAIVGYLSKFISTLMTTLFFEMRFRDSLTFSLVMSLRGQVELVLFLHWIDKKIIKYPSFTMMVLLTIAVTSIVTPLISILYDPTKPYMINRRRTIQHTPPSSEFRMLLCIHDQESISSLVSLLDFSNPTVSSPFSIYALHLIELVGRAAPLFIDHEKQEVPSKYAFSYNLHNVLKLYEEARADLVTLHSFTAVVPKRTMYQDVCELALVHKTTLIILPFHKEPVAAPGVELVRAGLRSLNLSVLAHAPCSVGVLVDKGRLGKQMANYTLWDPVYRFTVLFLGGADAREALVYADRMAGNLDVALTVIRFLSYNSEGDDEMEKKLDDGVVTRFWVKNESNERVVYKEVVVRNGVETVAAIQAMNDNTIDMWILGRKHGVNPVLLDGLSHWDENHELGIIGDYIASVDFGSTASVLVIQQQILREHRRR